MYRNVLILSVLALSAASPAFAQYYAPVMPSPARGGPMDAGQTHYSPSRADDGPRFNRRQAELLIRWSDVGKCVAAKDHDASLTYVTAKRKSAEATAAAARLDAVFTSCMAGSGIVDQGNRPLRRAALADALGVKLAA